MQGKLDSSHSIDQFGLRRHLVLQIPDFFRLTVKLAADESAPTRPLV